MSRIYCNERPTRRSLRALRPAWLLVLSIALMLVPFSNPTAAVYAGAGAIVNPHQVYTYDIMVRDMKALAARYPDLVSVQSLGASEYGRGIWSLDLGRGDAVVMLNGAHHAREWITTILLMTMADRYAQAYEAGSSWNGYSVRDLLDHVTFRLVPMVNPDGVTLQQKGLAAFPASVRPALLAMNGGSGNFKRWKANAKGIDLNRQYPADWQHISKPEPGPRYMNYKGKQPLQAMEARIMAEATKAANPEIAVAYHSSGEILYWNFNTPAGNVRRDRALAGRMSAMNGYRIMPAVRNPSGGGYTDWFIQTFGRPGLTPELGRAVGETHVPLSEFGRIWQRNRDTGWMLAAEAYKLWLGRQKPAAADGEVRLLTPLRPSKLPSLEVGKLPAVYPGKYRTVRSKGDWLELRTASGTVWVPERAALPGPFEVLPVTPLAVGPDTPLYRSPLDPRPDGAALTQAGIAHALERWREWYLVRTSAGVRWVKAADAVPAGPQTKEEGLPDASA